jgi:hypothetical protein
VVVIARWRLRLMIDKERLAVALVLLLFVTLAALYSVIIPVFEGYDEIWHYAYVQHIASGRGLPRQPPDQYPHLARQEGSQPPLYYLLASAATWWTETSDLTGQFRENPQFAPVPWGYRDNPNFVVHTQAERFPYRGTVLDVHLSRMISVLLGAGTVYATYALARQLFPEPKALALGAMLVTALTPGFLFASALVNNDILVAFLSSLTLLLLSRMWKGQSSGAMGIWLGVVLGCAALSKLSGLLLWPVAGVALAALAWRTRDWRILLRVALPAFALAVALSSWWYLRNWVLYHDVTGLNRMLDIVGRRDAGFGLADVWAEAEGIRRSYWALFGWFNVPVATWLYRVYDLACAVGLAGLVLFVSRAIRRHQWDDVWAVAFLLGWLLLSVIALVRWTLVTVGSQGRLLYPAVSAVSILLVRGWLALLPRKGVAPQWAVAGIGAAFLATAVYVPFFVISPAYAQPALLQPHEAGEIIAVESGARFEDQVTLLGYGIDRQEVKPGDVLWVTACWRGDTQMDEAYLVFVQLLADSDLIAAQKDTYHGLGSFPTDLWPAGATFCDQYPLRVSDTVPSPGQAGLSIGLYRASGERLQAYVEGGQPLGDNVRLAGPRIIFPDEGQVLHYEFGHRVALLSYRLDKTALLPGDPFTIILDWRAVQPSLLDYAATVQVLDEAESKIGQSDVNLRTSAWTVGETVADRRTIAISPQAAPGVYHIKVAVYDPATVENLPLFLRRQRLRGDGLLNLWTLRVLARPSQAY